jgi:hypothetical protein
LTEKWCDSKKYEQKEWPKGLVLKEDFVSEEEEGLLLETIQWNSSSELKHRRVTHFGFVQISFVFCILIFKIYCFTVLDLHSIMMEIMLINKIHCPTKFQKRWDLSFKN